jgi:hypothetical protein
MSEPNLPFKVKAIYEYKSDFEDDLAFGVGQLITVTEIEDEEWYSGTYDGKSGMFPKNFVENVPEPLQIPIPARPAIKKKDESVSEISTSPTSTDHIVASSPVNEMKSPVNEMKSPIVDTNSSTTQPKAPSNLVSPPDSKSGVGIPVFPTDKVNDPYGAKRQSSVSGKSSYIPKITPRDTSTIPHIRQDVAHNDSEIVRGSDVVQHEEDEAPKVSLKERIALLQQRQKEEAEREAAALKKQEERKRRLAEEKQKTKERKNEPGKINPEHHGQSAPEPVAASVTGDSQFSSHTEEQPQSPHDAPPDIPAIIPQHTKPYSEDEVEEVGDEEDEDEPEPEDEEEDEEEDEPESEDEELKRRKLVERMAKMSGGRNMFGMMGMASPFGTFTEEPKKASKKKTREGSDVGFNNAPEPESPSNPTQPVSAPMVFKSEQEFDEESTSRNIAESVLETNVSTKAPHDNENESLANTSGHIVLANLETGYDADEDSSDMARVIAPELHREDRNTEDEYERVPEAPQRHRLPKIPPAPPSSGTSPSDIPPVPSALSTSRAPVLPTRSSEESHTSHVPPLFSAPPVPIGQEDESSTEEGFEETLQSIKSSVVEQDSIPSELPPPPPLPEKSTTDDIEGNQPKLPPPPPPSSVPRAESGTGQLNSRLPPPPVPGADSTTEQSHPKLPPPPPPPSSIPVPRSDTGDSRSTDSDDEFEFTPTQAPRAKTELFHPPVPTDAPPNLNRARTDVADNRVMDAPTGGSAGLRRSYEFSGPKYGETGVTRSRSIRATEKCQAELSLEDLEYEIGNISGSSSWWLKGDLPDVLSERLGHDLIYEVDTNSIRKRGGRVINYRDYYIAFFDLSQIVFELEYESGDPRATIKFVNYFIKPIPIIRKDLLDNYHRDFSHLIINKAAELVGKQISEDVVLIVLHQIVQHEPKSGHSMLGPVGDKSFGVTIYKNFNNVNISKIDDIKPGDILWVKQGKFVSHKNLIGSKKVVVGNDDGKDSKAYCGIIYEFDNKKEKFKVIELDSTGHVVKESYKVGDFKSGKIRVFRSVGRDYIQWD